MRKYFKKLSFSISMYIVILVLLIGSGLGIYNISKYSETLNNEIVNKIQSPSKLMSSGLIDFEMASDKQKMELATGLKIDDSYLIGANAKIYYSTKKNFIGKKYTDIQSLKIYQEIIQNLSEYYIKKLNKRGDKIISISPIYRKNLEFLGYLIIKADITEFIAEKTKNLLIVSILAFIGLIASSVIILVIFNRNIGCKITRLLKITNKIKDGDLNVEVVEVKEDNEIGMLESNMNTLIEDLKLKVAFANEIEKGNFGFKYELKSKNDQLGKALNDMRNSLQKAAEEEKKRRMDDSERNWATQGLAKFADILRKNTENIEELTYSIISNLVNYVEANQASLFLLNTENEDEKPFLELSSCYAYDRRKYIKKRIEIGEGLVGAVAREKNTLHLTEIPESYIEITSGLGKANPKSLLIVPLMREDELLGILEMASFNDFKNFQVEFIEKLGESIASTIYNTKINATTSKLLHVSQEQSEQMRTQEEEMRQNMEELSATQEEMARKHKELNKKIEDLERELEIKNKQIERLKTRE